MIECELCKKWLAEQSLDRPNRCLNAACPILSPDARMRRAVALGRLADCLAADAAAADDRLEEPR